MCNGANLAFDRKKFLALDPYKYNQHISSGDDMFLMMEIQKKHSANIVFIAHEKATVYTKSKNSLSSYIDQRIRWASKSKHYQANSIKWVALLVLNMNAVLLSAPLTIFFFNWDQGFILFFVLLVIKQVADIAGLAKFSRVVNKEVKYGKFLLFQYIEALLTLIVALKSIKGSYVWKERKQHF
jgi:cellulose synthase/poly-beta-1,6-N-acetylglucosamine synthase-like glycosyltransferase